MGERTKGDIMRIVLHLIFQIVSLIAGLFVAAIGVLGFIPQASGVVQQFQANIRLIVINIYVMFVFFILFFDWLDFFGLLIMIFSLVFPPQLGYFFGFYMTFFGRGLFFIFIGFLILANSVLNIVICIVMCILGIFFMIFACIPVFPACTYTCKLDTYFQKANLWFHLRDLSYQFQNASERRTKMTTTIQTIHLVDQSRRQKWRIKSLLFIPMIKLPPVIGTTSLSDGIKGLPFENRYQVCMCTYKQETLECKRRS